jgi:hypothetical protein
MDQWRELLFAEDAMSTLSAEAHGVAVKNAGGAGRSTRSHSVMTTLPICSLDSRYW